MMDPGSDAVLELGRDAVRSVFVDAGDTQLELVLNRTDSRIGRDHVTVTVHPLQGTVHVTFQGDVT